MYTLPKEVDALYPSVKKAVSTIEDMLYLKKELETRGAPSNKALEEKIDKVMVDTAKELEAEFRGLGEVTYRGETLGMLVTLAQNIIKKDEEALKEAEDHPLLPMRAAAAWCHEVIGYVTQCQISYCNPLRKPVDLQTSAEVFLTRDLTLDFSSSPGDIALCVGRLTNSLGESKEEMIKNGLKSRRAINSLMLLYTLVGKGHNVSPELLAQIAPVMTEFFWLVGKGIDRSFAVVELEKMVASAESAPLFEQMGESIEVAVQTTKKDLSNIDGITMALKNWAFLTYTSMELGKQEEAASDPEKLKLAQECITLFLPYFSQAFGEKTEIKPAAEVEADKTRFAALIKELFVREASPSASALSLSATKSPAK